MVTNTDGAGNPQTSGCWNTTLHPNGVYTIEVTVSDLADNSATASLPVEVWNADIFVDSNGEDGDGSLENPFASITNALSQASQGDTIHVLPGVYQAPLETFPLVLSTPGVVLHGSGKDETRIQGSFQTDVSVIRCLNLDDPLSVAVIEGFSITGGGDGSNPNGAYSDETTGYGAAVYVKQSPYLIIQDCMIHGNNGFGIFVFETMGPSNPLLIQNNVICVNAYDNVRFQSFSDGRLYQNTILDAAVDGVRCWGCGNPWLDGNIIYRCGDYGVMAVPGGGPIPPSNPQINYCCLYANWQPFGGSAACTMGCLYDDPLLVDDSWADPILQQPPLQPSTSPCVDAAHIGWPAYGSTRTDYGADTGRLDMGFHYPDRPYSPTPEPIPTTAPVPTCAVTPTPGPELGILESILDYFADLLTISLIDPNVPGPGDPAVHVSSLADPVGFSMPLPPEATPGVYSGILGFVAAPTPSDPASHLLSVSNPDWLTIVYEDDSPVATVIHERDYAYGTPTPTPTPTATTGAWSAVDEYGNQGSAPEAFGWVDATGGTDLGIDQDDGWAELVLPFPFPFYGEVKTAVRVSANGYLTFGQEAWVWESSYLPRPEEPNDMVAAYWADLNPAVHGSIFALVTGSAPNRTLAIEWHEVPERYHPEHLTFEILLEESSGAIRLQYASMAGEGGDGRVATVGIENRPGSDGIRYVERFVPGTTYDGLAILLTPPSSALTPTPSPTPHAGDCSTDFEDGALGWTADGLWNLVDDGVSSCPPTPGSHSPVHSWHYGRDESCDYETGDANRGDLVSPPIQLAGLSTLRFCSWSEIEPGGGTLCDVRTVWVSVDDGASWDYAGCVMQDTGVWEQVELPLGEHAGPGRIRFRFDTVDDWRNEYRGWYVDDVEVVVLTPTPIPPPIPVASPVGLLLVAAALSLLLLRRPGSKEQVVPRR